MKVRWLPRASFRLSQITAFIGQSNPLRANKVANSLYQSVQNLGRFPNRGRRIPEFSKRIDIREVIRNSYRVIYKIESDRIVILTVWHQRQRLPERELPFVHAKDFPVQEAPLRGLIMKRYVID